MDTGPYLFDGRSRYPDSAYQHHDAASYAIGGTRRPCHSPGAAGYAFAGIL
jgi:hypothetical protein